MIRILIVDDEKPICDLIDINLSAAGYYCRSVQDGLGAIVNSSRGIIAAYKQEKYARFGAEHFAEASRQAVLDMAADINSVL